MGISVGLADDLAPLRDSAQRAGIFSAPGMTSWTRTRSGYLVRTLWSAAQIRLASPTRFEPVIATNEPFGRFVLAPSFSLARRKSRASIAVEVRCPLRLMCDPFSGCQLLPVSKR